MFNYNGLTLVLILVFSSTRGFADNIMTEDDLRKMCKLNMRISWATLGVAGIEDVAGLNGENRQEIFLTYRRAIDTVICNRLIDTATCKKTASSNLDIDTELTPSIELRAHCVENDEPTFCRTNFCDLFEYPAQLNTDDKEEIKSFEESVIKQASKLFKVSGESESIPEAESGSSTIENESNDDDNDDDIEVFEYENKSEYKDEL